MQHISVSQESPTHCNGNTDLQFFPVNIKNKWKRTREQNSNIQTNKSNKEDGNISDLEQLEDNSWEISTFRV